MTAPVPLAALAGLALALSLAACSDPTEAYTPVDQLPSADATEPEPAPAPTPADPALPPEDEALRQPAPVDPVPAPDDPEIPPARLPPLEPDPPVDEATRPPPVDPTMEDGEG